MPEQPIYAKTNERYLAMVEMSVRIFMVDAPEFFTIVHEMAKSVYFELNLSDVVFKGTPKSEVGGTAVYKLRVAPDHVTIIRDLAKAYLSKYPVYVDRSRQLDTVTAIAAKRDNGETEWKYT